MTTVGDEKLRVENPLSNLGKELPKNKKGINPKDLAIRVFDELNLTAEELDKLGKALQGLAGANMADREFTYESQSKISGGSYLTIGGSGGMKPGHYNTFVTLGRDTPSREGTGYGRFPDSGMIDLVAGRISSFRDGKGASPPKTELVGGREVDKTFLVANNMFDDAARVDICQRTDVDKNFGLVRGYEKESVNDSAVAIKADSVRLVGRKSLKIVTGPASLSESTESDSQGNDTPVAPAIELIAGNNVDTKTRISPRAFELTYEERRLQPVVTADRMVLAMKTQLDFLTSLTSAFQIFTQQQMLFNQALMTHSHQTNTFGFPGIAFPDPATFVQGVFTTLLDTFFTVPITNLAVADLTQFEMNFLKPVSPYYIGSSTVYATI